MNGILAIDKPYGWTSHDVVARVRKLARQKRIGHAGTLDPMATGVLLLCLGEATRLSDMLMDGVKWYLARIEFGARTDTDDALGTVVETGSVDIDAVALVQALQTQIGSIMQIPPSYAAIKRDGIPAYKRARAGESVELAAKPVAIYSLQLLRYQGPGVADAAAQVSAEADVLVCCSKGTYIRSLARDVGAALGCGAHLSGLRRLASGTFSTRDCRSMEALEREAVEHGVQALEARLEPPDRAVSGWPALVAGEQLNQRIRSGATFVVPGLAGRPSIRSYDDRGRLVALTSTFTAADGTCIAHPDKVFGRSEAR
ncbi:MAG: truB [Chloroflexi bacterium]|nr:truB [Chloroflexota bacterium]